MQPHSWVLADLFEVTALEFMAPDHVLEDDPSFEWVVCPDCDGQEWVECCSSAYAECARAWNRPDLAKAYKPCLRCNQTGEILDLPSPRRLRLSVSAAELINIIEKAYTPALVDLLLVTPTELRAA